MPPACGKKSVFSGLRRGGHGARQPPAKCGNPAEIGRICLECAAIFGHLPLTVRCRLGDYTTVMMSKRILQIGAALAAGAAGTSLALAPALAQGNPIPPGSVYSTAPLPYPSSGYPADYRRAPSLPAFDAMDDDDAPYPQPSLPAPGPVLSPDDPRYGRPAGTRPLYTDRVAP